MTRVLPRTNFHSSTLIRCLTDLCIIDAVEPENAFAEKLGLWVHFTDAIQLSAVHNDGIAASQKAKDKDQSEDSSVNLAIGIAFNNVKSKLENSISKSCSPHLGKSHIHLPVPRLELPMEIGATFTPYRRFYEAHQRDIELSIQPLRVNVRAALASASPQLKQLAELDAALEQILIERESKLLASIPVLLKKRFEHLFSVHQQHLFDTQQTDKPASWMQTGSWLAQFCQDMHMLLLAELELRLQPTMGLMEALKQEQVQASSSARVN
jgi:hypothetical protein